MTSAPNSTRRREAARVRLVGANSQEEEQLRAWLADASERSPFVWQLNTLSARGAQDVALVLVDEPCEALDACSSESLETTIVVLRQDSFDDARLSAVCDAGVADCLVWNELSAPLLERALRYALTKGRAQRESAAIGRHNVRLLRALQSSSLGVFVCGLERDNYTIVWMNEVAERLTGYSSSELVGRNGEVLLSPQRDEGVLGSVAQALREQRAAHFTLVLRHREGHPFWGEVHLSPLYDENNQASGWIAYLEDVTARVEAEHALHQSRRDLEFAQRLTHLGLFWLPLGEHHEMWGQAGFWSDELFRIIGLEPGAVPPSPAEWDEFVHPDDRERVRAWMEAQGRSEIRRRGGVTLPRIEHRLRLRDGSEKWVECTVHIEQDENGRKSRIIGTILDITERVHNAQELHEAQRRANAILNNAPLLLWGLDAHSVLTSIQGRALTMLGIVPHEMVGRSIFEVLEGDEKAINLAMRALAGEECEEEMWLGGRYLLIRYVPLPEGGALGLGIDMTDSENARQVWLDTQRRFESIVSNVPGVVYRFFLRPTGEMGFEFVSPHARDYWGDENAWRGRELEHMLEHLAPEDAQSLVASIAQSAATLSPWSWHGRVQDEKRATRWIRGLSRPFRRDDGTIIWDGLLLDETREHQAHIELERSNIELERSRAALEEAQSIARLGSFEWNLTTDELFWSKTMIRLLGYEPGEITPTLDLLRAHVHPDDLQTMVGTNRTCIATKTPGSFLVRIRRKDGQERFLQSHVHVECDPDGEPRQLVGTAQDMTENVLAQRALRDSEERYALAARGANDALWDWDLERNVIYLSARWHELVGLTPVDAVADPAQLLERVHPEDQEALVGALDAHLRGETPNFGAEFRIRHDNGSWVWMLCRGLAVRDESGHATRIAGSQTDITDRKRFEAQLTRSAYYDALTGLPNRALFSKKLERALTRENAPFAVLFLDLDRFKNINDSLGHVAGDRLLVEAGRRFEESLRPGDTVARLGGDEFAILLEGPVDQEQVEAIATRIRRKLERPITLDGHEVFVTVSIGIAPATPGPTRATDLLRNADTAMYRAKGSGRARHAVFDASMHQRAVRMLELESDLWRALERDELRVFYQPVIGFETGRIRAVEALVRWEHPTRGLVAPSEFIPLAEENGLIVPIGWWVLEEACRRAAIWGDELMLAVNLSSQQFAQGDMLERIEEILARTGFDPKRLHLEITESVIMGNSDTENAMLRGLREMGLGLSMDDFGTGYSSLSYLHRFPLDTLKIDRSFIAQLTGGTRHDGIVRTILDLAHNLDLKVVAEGIETPAQAELLRAMGCDAGQGFFFARPMPPEQLCDLLVQNPRW